MAATVNPVFAVAIAWRGECRATHGRSIHVTREPMIHGARTRGFDVMTEFFLNEALFSLRHLFPLTD
jgi:hypothetical protein